MMTNAPRFDTRDPEAQAAWAQWVTDSIVWLQRQVQHLHDCIETRTKETKDLIATSNAAAEELAESRHGQNLDTLERIGQTLQLLTTFRENATQKEIEQQAVSALLRQQAEARAKKREQIKGTAWKAAEYAVGAGVLTLSLAGILSIARMFGL